MASSRKIETLASFSVYFLFVTFIFAVCLRRIAASLTNEQRQRRAIF